MEDIFKRIDCFKEHDSICSSLQYGNLEDVPDPVVSILMPVYKRPDTFKKSLDSALNQDFDQPYEIVVVDNYDLEGESPNLKIVRQTGAKNIMYYHNESNLGMLGNWNRSIIMARAEYVTYCHDDDILLPNCLSRLMGLQKQTGRKCILSARNEIDENDKLTRINKYPDTIMNILKERDHYNYTLYDQFLGSRGFGVGCLFNRQCMLEIGGYNTEFYPSADYALQSCYTYYYGCVYNAIPTFNYRVAANESLNTYGKFVEVDRHFRQCMINKIHLPNFWLKRIIRANYNINKIAFSVRWGGASTDMFQQISFMDKFVVKIASFWHKYKAYELKV